MSQAKHVRRWYRPTTAARVREVQVLIEHDLAIRGKRVKYVPSACQIFRKMLLNAFCDLEADVIYGMVNCHAQTWVHLEASGGDNKFGIRDPAALENKAALANRMLYATESSTHAGPLGQL